MPNTESNSPPLTPAEHQHGKTTHVHAWPDVPHTHALRAICFRSECAGCEPHNIHPATDPA